MPFVIVFYPLVDEMSADLNTDLSLTSEQGLSTTEEYNALHAVRGQGNNTTTTPKPVVVQEPRK
jgi:hypothetical protein